MFACSTGIHVHHYYCCFSMVIHVKYTSTTPCMQVMLFSVCSQVHTHRISVLIVYGADDKAWHTGGPGNCFTIFISTHIELLRLLVLFLLSSVEKYISNFGLKALPNKRFTVCLWFSFTNCDRNYLSTLCSEYVRWRKIQRK